MFSKQKYINITAFVIINCVSILFFVKYAVIYTGHPVVLSSLFVLINAGIVLSAGNVSGHYNLYKRKFLLVFSSLVLSGVLLYILFVPRMGEIGRYPAIIDWIERFMAGTFPYNSPHTPSSYPVIFLIAYPFYLIGNIGLLEFIGAALFFYFVLSGEDTSRGKAVKILMLLSSIVFYYEIVTRSELFFNVMLVAGIVILSEKYFKTDKVNFLLLILALLTGLVLATRSVAALLFLIYFLYKFRMNFGNLLLFASVSVMTFAAFIVPLYLWDPVSFMNNGPFAVQSYLSNLPAWIIIIFFTAAIYSGWAISDIQEYFFSGGIILFSAAVVSFLFRVSELGFYDTLINDGYDIAYFIFCVPLLLLSVKDYQTDRYLGKIYTDRRGL